MFDFQISAPTSFSFVVSFSAWSLKVPGKIATSTCLFWGSWGHVPLYPICLCTLPHICFFPNLRHPVSRHVARGQHRRDQVLASSGSSGLSKAKAVSSGVGEAA